MKKILKVSICLLFIISVLSAAAYFGHDNDLRVYILDVEQGDGILIRTPNGQNIIIDGGPDNSFIYKLGKTLPFYEHTIDLMILTHPHADHVVGLIPVLARYEVKEILTTGVIYENAPYHEWQEIIKQKNIPVITAVAGEIFNFGETELKVIFPLKSLNGTVINGTDIGESSQGQSVNLNNTSVVVKVIYKNTSALFTGDLEKNCELDLIKIYGDFLKSDFLKIGHHGSITSTSLEFLQKVSPKNAAISLAQENNFGFPSEVVLNRLKRERVIFKLSSQDGDIIWQSNGFSFGFKSP